MHRRSRIFSIGPRSPTGKLCFVTDPPLPLPVRTVARELRGHQDAPRGESCGILGTGLVVLHLQVVQLHQAQTLLEPRRPSKGLGRGCGHNVFAGLTQLPLHLAKQSLEEYHVPLRLLARERANFLERQYALAVTAEVVASPGTGNASSEGACNAKTGSHEIVFSRYSGFVRFIRSGSAQSRSRTVRRYEARMETCKGLPQMFRPGAGLPLVESCSTRSSDDNARSEPSGNRKDPSIHAG